MTSLVILDQLINLIIFSKNQEERNCSPWQPGRLLKSMFRNPDQPKLKVAEYIRQHESTKHLPKNITEEENV